VAAAIAFSLALFSHILNHVTVRLQSALYDIENPRRVLKLPSSGIVLIETVFNEFGYSVAGYECDTGRTVL